jgi:hypothetical protein
MGRMFFGDELPTAFFTRRARAQLQARYRRDTRKGFTAKAETVDIFQVFKTRDLAGGMTGQGKHQILSMNSDAIIANSNESLTSVLDIDADASRAGVETVL